jgi:hypothetical protein
MKKLINVLLLLVYCLSSNAQLPSSFSWYTRHNYGYISNAKPQIINGPCGVFSAVAAVEAMCQIYYNNRDVTGEFDFSEAFVYNDNSQTGCPGAGCVSNDAPTALSFAKTTGFINNDCFPWPSNSNEFTDECIKNCARYCGTPSQHVYIPNYANEITITTDSELKTAILNYGPNYYEGISNKWRCSSSWLSWC